MDKVYVVVYLRLDPHSPGRILEHWDEGLRSEAKAIQRMDEVCARAKGYWTIEMWEVTKAGETMIDHICSHTRTHEVLRPAVPTDYIIKSFRKSTDPLLTAPPPDVIPPAPEVDEDFAFAQTFARVKEATEKEASETLHALMEGGESQGYPIHEPVARVQVYEMLPGATLAPPAPLIQRAHERMQFPPAWKLTKGAGVIVAVLDTGYRPHVALKGAAVSGVIDATGLGSPSGDANGHGTFCVSQIASQLPEGDPFGSSPAVRIVPIRVLHEREGYGADSWIARGIRAAIQVGAHVLSLSLGGDSPLPLTHAAIKDAVAAGCTVVVAAGNGGEGRLDVSYPARYPECLAVGAIDDGGTPAGFSQRGQGLTVWACGVAQIGATAGDTYGRWSGTSMACPHVAAGAALYYSRHREVLGKFPVHTDVRGILWATDAPTTSEMRGLGEARGYIQAGPMVESVKAPSPTPTPPDEPDMLTVDVYHTAGSIVRAVAIVAGWLDSGDARLPRTIALTKRYGDPPAHHE